MNVSDTAIEVVEAFDNEGTTNLVAGEMEFLSGVRAVARPIPITLLQRIQDKYRLIEPKPPEVFVDIKGTYEENREHPDYIREHNVWNQASIMAQLDVMLLKGLTITHIPEHMSDWKIVGDVIPTWLDELMILDDSISETDSPRRLYLYWLKYEACPSPADIEIVSTAIASKTGVSADGVDKEIERFPN